MATWPPSAILDVRKSLAIAFLAISDRSAILDVRKSLPISFMAAFLTISDQYGTFFFSAVILDVRKSLSIAFLAISDRSAILGVRKFTFDGISGHFRSIRNFVYTFKFLLSR